MKKIFLIIFMFSFILLLGCDTQEEPIEKPTLTVNKTSYEIKIGESFSLDYVITGSATININNLNDDIISINGDKVTGIKEGNAEINMYISNDDIKKVTVKVIKETEEILTVETKNYSIEKGEVLTDFYKVSDLKPNTIVHIISNNDKVVEVIENTIKAKAKGSAVITIFLSTKQNEKHTITVDVYEKSIEFLSSNRYLDLFSETALDFEVVHGTINDVLITSEDESIFKVLDNNKIYVQNEGRATIKISLKDDPTIFVTREYRVKVNPFIILDKLAIENVLVKEVTTHGENPKERKQMVYGAVSYYSFNKINIIQQIPNIHESEFSGKVATREILAKAEPMKLTRSGILLEELKYIVYHDTGNINPGADAKMHANYMASNDNKNNRARSWHYTVDEKSIYQQIPDNEVSWQGDSYDAYAKSIGIETCVNYGSDLYRVWQNCAKLIAGLLIKYNLDISAIKQHYDMSGKNCPQTLRTNNLYQEAIKLVEGELLARKYLSTMNLSFKSLSPEYLDNTGKVIKQPLQTTQISYMITNESTKESKIYYSVIKGTEDSSELKYSDEDLKLAREFDTKVVQSTINYEYQDIINLLNEYNALNQSVKNIVSTYTYLRHIEEQLLTQYKVDTKLMIKEVNLSNSTDISNYIMLYNNSDKSISIKSLRVEIIHDGKTDVLTLFDGYIQKNGYYLIGLEPVKHNKPISFDAATNKVISQNNFTIKISLNGEVLDTLSVGASDLETKSFTGDTTKAIRRKYNLDTNDDSRDFESFDYNPINSANETYNLNLSQEKHTALDLDYQILLLNRKITINDETEVKKLIDLYDKTPTNVLEFVKYKKVFERIKADYLGLLSPNIKIIYDAISTIPSRIVDDYILPKSDVITYTYLDASNNEIYNLQTGKYLKIQYEEKKVEIIASIGNDKMSFTVNLGIALKDDLIVFSSGAKEVSGGKVCDGYATFAMQNSTSGFGGVAIRCDNKVFFIGKNCLINLQKPASGNLLTKKELRPLGGENSINNLGIVNGVAREYSGTGALYFNASDIALTFDLSDTYGRNNSGAYGFFKVKFAKDNSGKYFVKEIMPNSGTNDTTEKVMVELLPGEYLWTPHTYETNVNGGTYFISPSSSTSGGVLTLNKELEIIYYKN